MNLKLPLEVEVPDELRVDDYTLTCKQVSEWEAVYRAENINDHYTPSINIDLSSGSIRGEFLGREYSDSFDVTGDYLYENLLSMAEEMSQSVNKKVKKSTPKPQSFSDMVKKQRSKNNINKSTDEEYDLMMSLGSLNYLLGAVRQTILNPEMFEEINKRISKTGGVNSLHDLEHLLDDWHDEIEDKLQTFR